MIKWWQSFLENLLAGKTATIIQMLMTITTWMTGLDKRLSSIETRLGSIEMALHSKGIAIPPVGSGADKAPL